MANKLFLIGINQYKHQSDLASCVKDVNDFKAILLDKFDFEEGNIYELKDTMATSKAIQDAFKGYSKTLGVDDNLIIFFSGHGEYEELYDRGYWVPYEAEDYTQFIPNTTIIDLIDKIKCKHLILISDSCFSNSILRIGATRNTSEYFEKSSRWALASAFYEARDADEYSNTLFAEAIIEALSHATKDIRFSEVVETVKKRFEVNSFQTPQGAPLSLQNHHGGEFIFKIVESHDERNLKGYVDFKKILQFYKRNSLFTEISTFEDKSNKIGYQLFNEVDDVLGMSTYYLYLYEGINQTRTLANLKLAHAEAFESRLVIFIPIEKDQKNIEIRKNNIKEKFNPVSVFYIDDFIREHCTPTVIQDDDSKYLNINNFITPEINSGGNVISLDKYFRSWHKQSENPILVIKGGGGIGKTTLAYHFADKLIKYNPSNYVLFIDSILIKDSLLKNKNRENLNLYNFYEALFDITENIQEKLSEDLFQLNVDAGNILIIIDGLDEIISKIPNFDTANFLRSIQLSSNDLSNGKIIITCRSYFWDVSEFDEDSFSVIELEPFTEEQTKEFFKKSFELNTAKISKSIKLANDFKFPAQNNKNIYHPYVLDIIRSIVDSESNLKDFELSELKSNYLSKDINNDYITYRVCDREIKRVGQIPVDEQVTFFIYLSVNRRGLVQANNLEHEIECALEKKVNRTNVEAFKSHPFLDCKSNVISFKYDFLSDLFKSIYISRFFNFDNCYDVVDAEFIDIVYESCSYGSPISIDVSKRIYSWDEENFLLVSDFITQVRGNWKSSKMNKVLANIFNLCLTINHEYCPNDIDNNTMLLKNIFSIKLNNLDGMNLIDLNFDKNIKFNFEGLEVSNSIIDNFGNFWKCKFDKKTKFINSELLNLNSKVRNSVLDKSSFVDCVFDSDLDATLNRMETNMDNKIEKMKIFVHDFFHLFVSNGRLGRQWEHKVISPRFPGINKCNLSYKKVIDAFKNNNLILITDELGKVKLAITDDNKANVNNYLKDGTLSDPIATVIKELL